MNTRTLITGLIVIIAALVAGYFFLVPPHGAPAPEDAMPAGWIRSAPNEAGITYAYPPTLGIAHISEVDWPPSVEFLEGQDACARGAATSGPMVLEKRTIGGREYCVERESEGAAGSTYITYGYTTSWGQRMVRVAFTLRFPQCLNYDDPEQGACLKEQSAFDPDGLAEAVMTSVILPQ